MASDNGKQEAPSPSSSIDYEALFERIKGNACRVDRIEKVYENSKEGKKLRTRAHIIDRELERVYDANTLEEIHAALEEAGRNLQKLQIFRHLQMLVYEDPVDDPELVSVMINVEEKNWYKAHAATYVQGNETACELGIGLHNLSGNAEHLVLSGEIGSERSNQFSASFEQPKPLDLPITASVRLAQLTMNHQKASSHTEQFRGICLGIRSFDDRHGLEYELGWRRLTDPSGVASRAVLAQVNDYVKSALKYSWTTGDKAVDESTGQTSGWALRCSSEVSGLGFDERMRFGKLHVDWQALLPITSMVSLSLSAAAGVMLPWGPAFASRPTCIADRFFLGGPSSLRGFRFKGVGATDVRRPPRTAAAGAAAAGSASSSAEPAGAVKLDALGGDLFASMMAALLVQPPLPALRALKVQGQLFVNGGNCVQLTGTGRSIGANAQDFSRTLRWSAGAGLVLPTVFGRFEANYVVVLSHQEHDRLKHGLQLGFAASSLM